MSEELKRNVCDGASLRRRVIRHVRTGALYEHEWAKIKGQMRHERGSRYGGAHVCPECGSRWTRSRTLWGAHRRSLGVVLICDGGHSQSISSADGRLAARPRLPKIWRMLRPPEPAVPKTWRS